MAGPPRQPGRRASTGERLAAAGLLGALPAIALGIYFAGRSPPTAAPPPPAEGLSLADLLPRPPAGAPLAIAVAPEAWPADKMYEKIDGEDRAYLKHGCLGLAAMTLRHAGTGETIDVFLYRFATPAGAEKVFAEQAPPDDAAEAADRPKYVDVGDRAYTSYGCCYLRAGPFYLKLIAGADTPAAAAATLKLARAFAAGRKEGT